MENYGIISILGLVTLLMNERWQEACIDSCRLFIAGRISTLRGPPLPAQPGVWDHEFPARSAPEEQRREEEEEPI